MTDETPIDLDELMSRDPTLLSKQDIDQIIIYHRKQRARRAAGEKPSRDTVGPKVDLSKIISGLKPKAVVPDIKRRV